MDAKKDNAVNDRVNTVSVNTETVNYQLTT